MINSKYAVGGIATVEDTSRRHSSAMSLQAVLVTDTFMTIFMACTVHVMCMYCVHAQIKESQESPEHTSEHVKSQKISWQFAPGPRV